jgi:hypothetical protein
MYHPDRKYALPNAAIFKTTSAIKMMLRERFMLVITWLKEAV